MECRHPTICACPASVARLRFGEMPASSSQEVAHERGLAARTLVLEHVEHSLVGQLRRPDCIRTLLYLVIDAAHESISRDLELACQKEGLDLPNKSLMVSVEDRSLSGEMVGAPAQYVAHQSGGFIVEVVAGEQNIAVMRKCCAVEIIPLGFSACRARGTMGGLGHGWNREIRVIERSAVQGEISLVCELSATSKRLARVGTNSQFQVEPEGLESFRGEQVPERKAVLAAGDGDEKAFVSSEHLFVVDLAKCSTLKPEKETRTAKRSIVGAKSDLGLTRAAGAFHRKSATTDHRSDLDRVVVRERGILGQQRIASDYQDSPGQNLEPVEQRMNPADAADLGFLSRWAENDLQGLNSLSEWAEGGQLEFRVANQDTADKTVRGGGGLIPGGDD